MLVVTITTGERNGYWLAREALAVALNRGERLAIVAVGTGHADERARMPEVTIERDLTAPVDAAQLVSVVADVARVRQSPQRALERCGQAAGCRRGAEARARLRGAAPLTV